MKQKSKNRGQLMSLLFTMLLFLVFVLCALFTVLIGGRVYENISSRMDENYTSSVALSYVANKVRQGDMAGMVEVVTIDGIDVLQLKQEINQQTYVTQIYYKDGAIWELFTSEGSGLTLDDGLEILPCDDFLIEMEGSMLRIQTLLDEGSQLLLHLRSGGGTYE